MKLGRRTFNSSQQIYHRRQRWAMEVIFAVGTKLYFASRGTSKSNCSENFAQLTGNNIQFLVMVMVTSNSRCSRPEVFLGKGVLKICSKFTREQPCQSDMLFPIAVIYRQLPLYCSEANRWLQRIVFWEKFTPSSRFQECQLSKYSMFLHFILDI